MRKRWIVVGVLSVAIVAGFATGFFHAVADGYPQEVEGHFGLPSCDSETGLTNLKGAINNLFKQYNVTAFSFAPTRPASSRVP